MTPDLITLEDARMHLRLDSDSAGGPDDYWLLVMIPAISNAIGLWLKDGWRLYQTTQDSTGDVLLDSSGEPVSALDSAGDPLLQSVVRAACLIELERQYRFRGGEGGETDVTPDAGYGYTLGKGATALLTPLRRPTIG